MNEEFQARQRATNLSAKPICLREIFQDIDRRCKKKKKNEKKRKSLESYDDDGCEGGSKVERAVGQSVGRSTST